MAWRILAAFSGVMGMDSPANDLAGMLLAELLPGEVQGFVKTVFADAGQALGLGRRAVVGNRAEGLSPSDPDPQVESGDRIGDRIGGGWIIHVVP